jgi:hypothetical protein
MNPTPIPHRVMMNPEWPERMGSETKYSPPTHSAPQTYCNDSGTVVDAVTVPLVAVTIT